MNTKTMLRLMALLSALAVLPGWAASCIYDPGRGPSIRTLPLVTANISVGADVSVGSVIHRQTFAASDGAYPQIRCAPEGSTSPFTVSQYLSLVSPPPLVPGWGGLYAGALYQTSLPGVGVAYTNNDGQNLGTAFTTAPLFKWSFDVAPSGPFFPVVRNKLILVFVKTGPISAGAISGAQLPTTLLTMNSASAVTGLPTETFRWNFSGTLNVTVSSCQTPDVSVPLGSYGLDKYFNGKQSTTPWVPFSIRLLNCPAFRGGYTSTASPPGYLLEGTTVSGTRVNNSLVTTLSPTYGAYDSARGIINLDRTSGVAQGIGIQLASGLPQNPSPTVLNLSSPLTQPVYTTSVTDQSIALQARYIATSGTATPGPASSKVVFTINYY